MNPRPYEALLELIVELGYEPAAVSMLHVEPASLRGPVVVVEHVTPAGTTESTRHQLVAA